MRKNILRTFIASVTIGSTLIVPAFAESATVTGNGVNFRVGPGMNYYSIGTLDSGTSVEVTDRSNGSWYAVSYGGYNGFISATYLGAVALTDQHRRAEVCEGSHEHQQGCGQQGGHDEGDDYLEEAGEPGAAQVLRRLDQGVVDVLQRTLGIQEHQREQLQRHDQHDAAEAVDVRDGDAQVLEEGGDHAAAPQQQ